MDRFTPNPKAWPRPGFPRFLWQSKSPHDGHAAPAGDFLIVRDQRELVLERGGADEPFGGIFVRPIKFNRTPCDARGKRQDPKPVTEVFEP